MKVRDITYIGFAAALISVCSWVSIPTTVPFTLQTFAIFFTLALLGGKRGTLACLVYIFLGTVGVPVFSGFKGGIGALIGTTGGYIIGFLLLALVVWGITHLLGDKTVVLAAAMLTGLLVCYAFGTLWFIIVYIRTSGSVALMTVLSWCVFPFIIPDIVKIFLALLLAKRLKRYVK